jgi:uncharacterized metal-binding protein YceD (DUF177 family)
MEFKGKVSFREVDRNRVEYVGNEKDAWVRQILVESAPQVVSAIGLDSQSWAKKAKFKVQVSAERMGTDYLVRGHFNAQVLSPCSRCGDSFEVDRNSQDEFRVVVSRVLKGQNDTEEALDSGDPDFLITDSDELNFIEILREQLIILEPLSECPEYDAAGQCSLCGIVPKTQMVVGETSLNSQVSHSVVDVLSKIKASS